MIEETGGFGVTQLTASVFQKETVVFLSGISSAPCVARLASPSADPGAERSEPLGSAYGGIRANSRGTRCSHTPAVGEMPFITKRFVVLRYIPRISPRPSPVPLFECFWSFVYGVVGAHWQ